MLEDNQVNKHGMESQKQKLRMMGFMSTQLFIIYNLSLICTEFETTNVKKQKKIEPGSYCKAMDWIDALNTNEYHVAADLLAIKPSDDRYASSANRD